MRFIYLIGIGLAMVACSKEKRVVKQLEGTWNYTELLKTDGSQEFFNEKYTFSGGDADGKTYLPWTVYGTDTAVGSYLVLEKGAKIILRKDYLNPVEADTCSFEDLGKDIAIIRSVYGVMYLRK